MYLPKFLLAALLPLAVFASPISVESLDPAEIEERSEPCPRGAHILALGGHGSPPHGYGLLNTTVYDFLQAIPGSNNYSIIYPKNSLNYSTAAMIGVEHLTSSLEKYTTRCPDTPIVLVGYSEGAIVVMNTLCGRSHIGAPYSAPIDSKYAKYIMATVVYGDESRVPYQSYNLGTCAKGQGDNPRGNPQGCAAFESNIVSYCDRPDPECCGGNNMTAHYQYGAKYNTVASQYIADKFAARNRRGSI